MKVVELTDSEIIDKLKNRDERTFQKVYNKCKSYSLAFLIKNGADYTLAEDIYQDACVVLYQNLQKPEFKLTCSIQTYLNSICRNRFLTIIEEEGRIKIVQIPDGFQYVDNINDWHSTYVKPKEERIQAIEKKLEEIKNNGGRCWEILENYYYLNKSMDQIAEIMEYTNGSNVKQQKSRCLQKLKEMVLGK